MNMWIFRRRIKTYMIVLNKDRKNIKIRNNNIGLL